MHNNQAKRIVQKLSFFQDWVKYMVCTNRSNHYKTETNDTVGPEYATMWA